jgi:protein-L-isoaspartate(D-aspartate) O-methyltransferase
MPRAWLAGSVEGGSPQHGAGPLDPVVAAFRATPRAGFLLPEDRARAAYDGPIPIGHGQTSSQPRTVAAMLRLLEVEPGHSVLDVGAGSGWTTALLAHMVGTGGRVVGVERIPELVAFGAANLAATGRDWARIELAVDGQLGWPADGPYDRILVSADARDLPEELVAQLVDGGRMVVPVNGTMLVVKRSGPDVATSRHGMFRFVPLL